MTTNANNLGKIINPSNGQEVNQTEAAKIIGVKPNTLAAWRCTKKQNIPFYKIGSRVIYKISDLLEWKEKQRVAE